jgi:hypothetical protein
MREYVVRALRSLGAVTAGYAVIVVCTTLGFEVLLGGIDYDESSAGKLLAGGFVAVASGLLGGLTAAWLGGRARVWHAAGILVWLAMDTAVVLSRGGKSPLWFELGGSLTLMGATVAGGLLFRMLERPGLLAARGRDAHG